MVRNVVPECLPTPMNRFTEGDRDGDRVGPD